MGKWVFVFALAGAGCSSGSHTDAPRQCGTAPSGSYQVTTQVVSGNCGPASDFLVYLDTSGAMSVGASGCRITAQSKSADGCDTDASMTCRFTDGSSASYVVSLHRTSDVGRFGGVMSMSVYDAFGNFECAGEYNITYQKV